MSKVYIVSKQLYEEFYIYGIFSSKKELEKGITELAVMELEDAKQSRKKLQNWFDKTHVPWAKYHNIEPTRPTGLDMDLVEYSKSIFDTSEIEINEAISNPNPAGWKVKE